MRFHSTVFPLTLSCMTLLCTIRQEQSHASSRMVLCTSILLPITLRYVGLTEKKKALFVLEAAIGCGHAERSRQTLTAAQVSVSVCYINSELRY